MLSGKYVQKLFSFNTQLNFLRLQKISTAPFKIGVQAAPFGMGQRKQGVEQGPETIKSTGFIEALREIGVDIEDCGVIQFPSVIENSIQSECQGLTVPLRNTAHVGSATREISKATSAILKENKICLTLGGDHSIAIGTVHGASEVYDDLAVLWIDAHADLNTPLTTSSGNLHGMPLSFLIEEMQPFTTKLDSFSWVTPRIKVSNVAYIGLRDVDHYERESINSLGITAYSMEEVQNLGIERVTQEALQKITNGFTRPLHLSFDIDGLDDLEARSTGTPVPGGLTLREGLSIVQKIRQKSKLISMDLVEVNPLVGTEFDVKRTANAAKQILLSTFGYYRGGVSLGSLPKPKS